MTTVIAGHYIFFVIPALVSWLNMVASQSVHLLYYYRAFTNTTFLNSEHID